MFKWLDADRGFRFENPRDSTNELFVVPEADGVTVTVSEEQAMDSYNETFSCNVTLDRDAAIRLRDYLNTLLPPGG